MTNTNKKYYTVLMYTKSYDSESQAVYATIQAKSKEQANQIAVNKYEPKGYEVNTSWTKQKIKNKTEAKDNIKEEIEFFDWEYRRARAKMRHFKKIKDFYEQQYEDNK